MTEQKKEFHAALAAAQDHVKQIEKLGRGQRASCVTSDDVVRESREAFRANGLLHYFTPPMIERIEGEIDTTTGVISEPSLVVRRNLIIVHIETGQALHVPCEWPMHKHTRDEAGAAASHGTTYALGAILQFERVSQGSVALRQIENYQPPAAAPVNVAGIVGSTYHPTPTPSAVVDPNGAAGKNPVGVNGNGGVVAHAAMQFGAPIPTATTADLAAGAQPGDSDNAPPDPTPAQLAAAGMSDKAVAAIAVIGSGDALFPNQLKDMFGTATKMVGGAVAREIFASVGVELKQGAICTGYQARLFSLAVFNRVPSTPASA